MKRSSVRITSQTRSRLKKLKSYKNETYDEILSKILDAKLGNMVITYSIKDKYNIIYATIDYNMIDKNIIYEYENTIYNSLNDLPLPISFKKNLSRVDLFNVLPPLNYGDEVRVCNNNTFLIKNITEDIR